MPKLRLKLLLLTLLAALSIGAVAHAASFTTSKANVADATASATTSSSVFDLAFGLRENKTDVVDESNEATAYATCDGCRAIAVAFQVVIVQGKPSTVTPTNDALAVNYGCSGCSVLAIAHQFVVGRGEPSKITSRGRSQLAAVADDLLRLERSYKQYSNAEIESRVNANADKVRATLASELVAIDGDGDPDVDEDRDTDRD